MATRIFLDDGGTTVIVHEDSLEPKNINLNNFLFEENQTHQRVTLKDTSDGYSFEVYSSSVLDFDRVKIGSHQEVVNFLFSLLSSPNASRDFVFVNDIFDFPAAVGNVITLKNNATYYIVKNIDLNGLRLVCGVNTTILGASSENCSITSTSLDASSYLITSNYTLPIRHITIKDVAKGVIINPDDTAAQPIALDWTGVNFSGCTTNLYCNTIDNFIFSKGAILGGGSFIFNGAVGTIGIDNSIFVGSGSAYNIVDVTSSAVITRRFRIIYSSFVAFGSTVAIDVDAGATVPTEGFILDTVNFSGGGTYLGGLTHTSNDSLFTKCTGITNTAVNGQAYMQNNATATTIAVVNTFYKVAGTTSASPDNSKFSHTSNRLTCDAIIRRKYLIQCTLSFNSTSGNVCEFGFYDSQLAAVRTPSRTKATANAAGRAENVTFSCVLEMDSADYLEIHCANTTGTNNITVSDLNFVITEIR